MSDPSAYTVSYDFSGFQATSPSTPLPAPALDDELASIESSIGSLVDAVRGVRRSDGALQNGVVTIDSLAAEVVSRFEGSSAYLVAVENGFSGTESEWLASLAGDDGDNGAAATIAVGTVTTLAPGSQATVENVGSSNAAVFNFGLPRGPAGLDGDGSGDMVAATYDPTGKTADAFDMENMAEGATKKILTSAERTKLSGVASGATANATNGELRDRGTHTGFQAISTVSGLQAALDGKQPLAAVLAGTTASFTTALETKLTNIAENATANDTDENLKTEYFVIAASDEVTALTTGTGKARFRMPCALTLVAVRASLTTAQSSGNIFTVDINEGGTSILSTKLTIDNTEKTSTTAATPAVISDADLADDAEITIDIDQIGNGTAAGLKVTLIGYRS